MSHQFDTGITISLVDKVSAALGAIAVSLARTNTAAAALNARMKLIQSSFKTGLIMAGGGAALAAPLVMATKEAEKYAHQLNQMRSAGLSNKEMAESIGAAWKTTGSVITSTATENLKVIMDLRSVFGHTAEGIEYMPRFAKIQGAYASVLDGKLASRADEQTFAMAKALDMIGAVKNKDVFEKSAAAMFRVTEATGGRVLPSDYQTTFKYARQAKFGMNDEFLYKVLPELILENKGGGTGSSGGVGPQLAALYRFGVQGIMKKAAFANLEAMGMVPSTSKVTKTTTTGTTLSGGILGSDLLAKNPFEWVQKVFVPHLAKRYNIDPANKDKLVQASNQVFMGNQLATSLVAELIKKNQQYTRFGGLYDKTDNIDQAYARGMKNDPAANWKALGAALDNLKVAIGEHVIPVLVPMVNQLSQSIQRAAGFLHAHPAFAKALAGITALTAGVLILGGVLNIARAGFMGLQLVLGPLGPMLRMAWAAVGPLVARMGGFAAAAQFGLRFLGPLGIALTVAALAFANWSKIVGFFNKHQAFFIHIAAEAARAAERLSASIAPLISWFGQLASQIGKMVANIGAQIAKMPFVGQAVAGAQAMAQQVQKAVDNAMKVDSVTAKRDLKYLQSKGFIPAVNQTNHIVIQQVPGHDHEKCAATATKKLSKNLRHAASAASGNSTGRSINQHGNYRP